MQVSLRSLIHVITCWWYVFLLFAKMSSAPPCSQIQQSSGVSKCHTVDRHSWCPRYYLYNCATGRCDPDLATLCRPCSAPCSKCAWYNAAAGRCEFRKCPPCFRCNGRTGVCELDAISMLSPECAEQIRLCPKCCACKSACSCALKQPGGQPCAAGHQQLHPAHAYNMHQALQGPCWTVPQPLPKCCPAPRPAAKCCNAQRPAASCCPSAQPPELYFVKRNSTDIQPPQPIFNPFDTELGALVFPCQLQ